MTVASRTGDVVREVLVVAGLVALFVVTSWVNFRFYSIPEIQFVHNDVSYYGYHLDAMLETGDTSVMAEYPMPAVWLLQLVYTIGGGWQHWLPWFAAIMIGLVAIVAMTLYRVGNAAGAAFWIVFIGACGPLVWFRFDLIPAAVVAWACLCITTRPRLAGALVAIGASVKLWPALFALPMAAPNPLGPTKGRQRLVAFLVAGLALATASLVAVGWDRSASPITWQGDRGLQMESVPASPLMFLRAFTDNPSWTVDLSEFNAIELYGPGVDLLLAVSTALTVGSLALTGWLTWRLMRTFRTDSSRLHEAILLAILAILLATIVANKTLSPQYVPWFAGPLAALLVTRRSAWLRRHVIVQAVGMVAVAALTQYTYPWGTQGIMSNPNGSGFETSVLLLRNLLLVAMLVHAVALAVRATRPGTDEAPDLHPPALTSADAPAPDREPQPTGPIGSHLIG